MIPITIEIAFERKGKTKMKMGLADVPTTISAFLYIIISTLLKWVQFEIFSSLSFDDSVLGAFNTTAI